MSWLWLRRRYLRLFLTLLPVWALLPHTAGMWRYAPVADLDRFIYDQRLRSTMPRTLDPRIVIVDVDETSLRQVGRWPWGRDSLAALVEELVRRQQVLALGFDLVFAETDIDISLQNNVQRWAVEHLGHTRATQRAMASLQQHFDRDAHFADALRGQPVVMAFYMTSDRQGMRSGQLPAPLQLPPSAAFDVRSLLRFDGYAASLPRLARAAPRAGFVNAIADDDGVVRSIALLAAFDTRSTYNTERAPCYPALSLALLQEVLQQPAMRLQFVEGTQQRAVGVLDALLLEQDGAQMRLPVDARGMAPVPFRGPGGRTGGSFRYVSASDVLQGKLAAGELRGTVVLIGTTVPGLFDMRATPVAQVYPGVEVHANMLSAMLDGRMLQVPDYARGYATLSMLSSALLLALSLPSLGVGAALLLLLGVGAALVTLNSLLYLGAGLVLPLAAPLLAVFTVFVLDMTLGFLAERRARRQIVELFGHYVPHDLVDKMVRAPQTYSMAAQARELSVMFSDVTDFASISETMQPQELQAMFNRLFNAMSQVIAQHQGTIDKYIGDCVMVFWGAPLPDALHAAHAVETALGFAQMLEAFNAEQSELDLPALRLGTAINTGLMSVGDMGSDQRRNYTVMGDAVNIAARLEALTRAYGEPLLVGEQTVLAAPRFHWQWVDSVRVTGKMQSVEIHTPLGSLEQPLSAVQRSALQLWEQYRQHYRQRNWEQCLQLAERLQEMQPQRLLYKLHARRAQRFINNPPPQDWDGVIDAEK